MTADVHVLTGAYAADALDTDERRFFEQHVEACDACAQEVAELQETVARLGVAASETPPPGLRARVMAEVDGTRQEAPRRRDGTSDAARPWWGRLGAIAAAAVLVVGTGVGLLVADYRDRIDVLEQEQARYAELMAAPDAQWVEHHGDDGSLGRVVLSASRGEALLMVDGMDPAPHEHTYELWLIGASGAVPAGLFDVDDTGRVTHLLSADFEGTEAIGVTVEPEGGSPQPTTDPVMVLELATGPAA